MMLLLIAQLLAGSPARTSCQCITGSQPLTAQQAADVLRPNAFHAPRPVEDGPRVIIAPYTPWFQPFAPTAPLSTQPFFLFSFGGPYEPALLQPRLPRNHQHVSHGGRR